MGYVRPIARRNLGANQHHRLPTALTRADALLAPNDKDHGMTDTTAPRSAAEVSRALVDRLHDVADSAEQTGNPAGGLFRMVAAEIDTVRALFMAEQARARDEVAEATA